MGCLVLSGCFYILCFVQVDKNSEMQLPTLVAEGAFSLWHQTRCELQLRTWTDGGVV